MDFRSHLCLTVLRVHVEGVQWGDNAGSQPTMKTWLHWCRVDWAVCCSLNTVLWVHRIPELLKLEGSSESIWSNSCSYRGTQNRLLRRRSRWILKVSEEKTPQSFWVTCARPTSTVHCCFLVFRKNLLYYNFWPRLLVLEVGITAKSLSLSSSQHPFS